MFIPIILMLNVITLCITKYREEIHDDIFEKVTDTRREAMAKRLTVGREGIPLVVLISFKL